MQNAMLAQLVAELDAVDTEVCALQPSLREESLLRTAPAGGWSVGQVFEHLIVSNSLYYATMEKVLGRARPAGKAMNWRPTLLGRLLFDSLSPCSTRKLPAPRVFRPGPAARANVVECFLDSQEHFRALARKAESIDLRRTRLSSPLSPLFRLNLGDAFRIIVVHEQRHLQQIGRILER